nr:hypothetical protein Q903MT_gene4907 [Picea sitchensis]
MKNPRFHGPISERIRLKKISAKGIPSSKGIPPAKDIVITELKRIYFAKSFFLSLFLCFFYILYSLA